VQLFFTKKFPALSPAGPHIPSVDRILSINFVYPNPSFTLFQAPLTQLGFGGVKIRTNSWGPNYDLHSGVMTRTLGEIKGETGHFGKPSFALPS